MFTRNFSLKGITLMVVAKIKKIINQTYFVGKYINDNGLRTTLKRAYHFQTKYGYKSLANSLSVASQDTIIQNPIKVDNSNYYNELQSSLYPSPFFTDYEDRKKLIPEYDQKLICFYLPQFHPFEENNKFWGEGFTEWTNVSKAYPFFKGHNQPRLPKDLGFYDLRLKENLVKQAAMAKNYGIYGFCFHYYWFSGRKVMDTPINILANNKDINQNFCICWANENWTRRWDGNDKEILLEQLDNEEDYLNFIKDISIYFNDSRYIKIDGAPLLVIYRAEIIKNPKHAANIWRTFVKEMGFPDLHLVMSESFEARDPRDIGFNASVDFAPNSFHMKEVSSTLSFFNSSFRGYVFDYETATQFSLSKKKNYPFYHSICLEWDNSARKGAFSAILKGCTPISFHRWLSGLIKLKPLNNLTFINAWNEWAEGTYLEPDRKNGFAYLQKCYEALNLSDNRINTFIYESNKKFIKKNQYSIVLHLHYFDAIHEIIKHIQEKTDDLDFIISLNTNLNLSQLKFIKENLPNVFFYLSENQGRDVLPFLKILKTNILDDYIACCKIHSKKSPHLSNGTQWRDKIYSEILQISKFEKIIKDAEADTAIWTTQANIKNIEGDESINIKRLKTLLKGNPKNGQYISGTMFWFRPLILKKIIKDEYLQFDFETEPLQRDGSWAHVFERFFMEKIAIDNYKTVIIPSEENSFFNE